MDAKYLVRRPLFTARTAPLWCRASGAKRLRFSPYRLSRYPFVETTDVAPSRRPGDPTNHEGFETALSRLVSTAEETSIDIEGAYDVRTPEGDRDDYTVEITVIQKRVPEVDDDDDD